MKTKKADKRIKRLKKEIRDLNLMIGNIIQKIEIDDENEKSMDDSEDEIFTGEIGELSDTVNISPVARKKINEIIKVLNYIIRQNYDEIVEEPNDNVVDNYVEDVENDVDFQK